MGVNNKITRKDIKLAKQCAKHWKVDIVDRLNNGNYKGCSHGEVDCAFCWEYSSRACKGCPLDIVENNCNPEGSSWDKVVTAWNEKRSNKTLIKHAKAMIQAIKDSVDIK